MRPHIDNNKHVNKRRDVNRRRQTFELLSTIHGVNVTIQDIVNRFDNPNYYLSLIRQQVYSLVKEKLVYGTKVDKIKTIYYSLTEKGEQRLEAFYTTLSVDDILRFESLKTGVLRYYIREQPSRNELKLLYHRGVITSDNMGNLNTPGTYLVFCNAPGTPVPRVVIGKQPKVLNDLTHNFMVLKEIHNG